jgi:hypothetical protein
MGVMNVTGGFRILVAAIVPAVCAAVLRAFGKKQIPHAASRVRDDRRCIAVLNSPTNF